MPRRYTPEEKSTALIRLAENYGNIVATSLQLGIPIRTLRDWRNQKWLSGITLPSPFSPPSPHISPSSPPSPPPTPSAGQPSEELPPFENDLEAINYLRHQMLDDLLKMAHQLHLDAATATPYQRLILIPQLLDRLMKLDQHLKPYQEEEVIYRIADSEGEEPDHEPDEKLEFFLLLEDGSIGPLEAIELKKEMESVRAIGLDPSVSVRFWRRINDNDDYWCVWKGIFPLTITVLNPADNIPPHLVKDIQSLREPDTASEQDAY